MPRDPPCWAVLGRQGLKPGVRSRLGSTGPGWAAARLSLGCRRAPAHIRWYSYAEPIGLRSTSEAQSRLCKGLGLD